MTSHTVLSKQQQALTQSSRIAARLVVLLSIAALIGWLFQLPILTAPPDARMTIKPASAVAFLLSGSALWLRLDPTTRAKKRIAQAFAALVLGIGLATLVEYLFNFNFGIDPLLSVEIRSALP